MKSWRWSLWVVVAMATVMSASDIAPTAARASEVRSLEVAPVAPMRVIAAARIPAEDWHPGHRGVDLEASEGDVVVAPAGGTVTFVGTVVDRPIITVTHDNGLRSSMEPVASTLERGDRVGPGEPVGVVAQARSHCAPALCLHWGVREGEHYVDPLDVLAGWGPIRLLPRDRAAAVT
jgi:murein DD-endopeptidase MepM/ murein hydrolase activator NlpD